MKTKKLVKIPPPDPKVRSILDFPVQGTGIRGEGDLDLVCGGCDYVIGKGVFEGQFRGIVLRCPMCRNYSDT